MGMAGLEVMETGNNSLEDWRQQWLWVGGGGDSRTGSNRGKKKQPRGLKAVVIGDGRWQDWRQPG